MKDQEEQKVDDKREPRPRLTKNLDKVYTTSPWDGQRSSSTSQGFHSFQEPNVT